MLLDPLDFSSNSILGLPLEFINGCKAEITVIVPIANNITTIATDIPKQDHTNFLLIIQFVANSTHMEGLPRTSSHATWITNGIIQLTPFQAANGTAATCVNILAPRDIVFSSVLGWNLIVTTDNHPDNGECYATNVSFNI
jgi:hypothetical protein